MGRSLKVEGSDTIVLEWVRLFLDKTKIVYAPIAIGQNDEKEVQFQLKQIEHHQFVFENKKHDFSQRVIYHLTSDDSLHAWIEGKINVKTKKSDYNYIKINDHD